MMGGTFLANGTTRDSFTKELIVSQICCMNDLCETVTLTPMTNLYSAELIMNTHGTNQLPVISEHVAVGILDRECINIACRALAIRVYLSTLGN
ncbi:hypothetical protein L1987_37781 [Smallanthus sonchifolius]|uniref:Uncharacterized protein n=1 Tax=Smallanthus sonchifolius TaxID=185202 RepID=A0ACB9HH43_9ASTR|nr:hypothetical protein L1987_37781 [Smallanthus sonchifolius]